MTAQINDEATMIHDLQFHAIKAMAERRREEQARELGITPLQLYYREQAEKLIRERKGNGKV